MNISEKGVTFGVTLTYRSRKSLMQKGGTPERTRTSDLVFRKHPLYPTELREHNGGDVPLASVGWGHGTVKVGQAAFLFLFTSTSPPAIGWRCGC